MTSASCILNLTPIFAGGAPRCGADQSKIGAAAGSADPDEFAAHVIPAGHSPDRLRTDPDVVAFTRAMVSARKPGAAICQRPQLLIEAEVVRGKRVTSWRSVRTDLENAGATRIDAPVVQGENLITSRQPADPEAFDAAWLAAASAVGEC